MVDNYLKQVEAAVSNPAALISGFKEKTGRKAVGLVLTDVPEELVLAAGALPVAALGREVSFQAADRHLQSFACSYSRTIIELIERGELDFLDGLIVPYACDTTRCLDLILRYMNKFEFYDCLRIPKRTTAAGTRKYFKEELKRLAKGLSRLTGREVNDESLKESIKAYNRVRGRLQKMREMMRQDDARFPASSYFLAVQAAMVLPPEESEPLLDKMLESEEQTTDRSPGIPVILAGKMAKPPGLVELIEQSGLRIVEDHLVVGGRWVEAEASEDLPPLDALVERQIRRLPFSGIWDDRPSRASFLLERVQALKAKAVVYLVQKFCEPAELEWPGIKKELESNKIPMLVLETDLSSQSLEAVKTRVQAFAEML